MTQTTNCPRCGKTIQNMTPGGFTYVKDIRNPDFCGCSRSKTTNYARPEGTRGRLYMAAVDLRKLADEIDMPGDFAVRARNLCVEMENERNRAE